MERSAVGASQEAGFKEMRTMRRVRRRRAIRVMLVVVVAASEAGGVTLEELAARMERLERKVAAYEARYGPLDEGAMAGKPRSAGRSASAAMPGETLPGGRRCGLD